MALQYLGLRLCVVLQGFFLAVGLMKMRGQIVRDACHIVTLHGEDNDKSDRSRILKDLH